jgi:hypothetical protein
MPVQQADVVNPKGAFRYRGNAQDQCVVGRLIIAIAGRPI